MRAISPEEGRRFNQTYPHRATASSRFTSLRERQSKSYASICLRPTVFSYLASGFMLDVSSSGFLGCLFLCRQYNVFYNRRCTDEGEIYCILATDTGSSFAPASEFSSGALGNARLGMAYIRDALHLLRLSYISVPINISDLAHNESLYQTIRPIGTM